MTTAFDGSTTPGAAPPYPPDPRLPAPTGFDTLSLLKETVAERVEIEPVTLTVPGGRIRLTCHSDIPEKDLRKWQRASLPQSMRKGKEAANATALDQNQLVIAVAVLVNTSLRIDVLGRDNQTWHVVEHDDEPLTLRDAAVLSAFNAIDTTSALITVFGRESDIIRASQEVLAAAGWTGENGAAADDEDDPQ